MPEGNYNQQEGVLSNEFISSLQTDYRMTDTDRALRNAIAGTDLKKLALNRQIIEGEDGFFSHRIETKGVTNQKASGRCWIFAGLNTLRPKVIRKLNLDEFEFSAAYLLFWDKFEKSNLYLENVIELRKVDRLDREWQLVNEWMVGDGGWWNYVASLVEKYGVVPASVMPESHSSEHTHSMNLVLKRLLQSRAAGLLKADESGSDETELRKMKEEILAEVYRILVLNLGQPPEEFEWRYTSKKKTDEKINEADDRVENSVVNKDLSELKSYTPKSFYSEFVDVELSNFITLYHDPGATLGQHYRFNRVHNIVGQPQMSFANIDIEVIKEIAVKSVLENQPMWFAVNMGVDQSTVHGIMEVDLFDYQSLLDIEMPLSKADRSRFNAGASNHAMVLRGVDLVDGKPRKWLVENSWGSEKGNKGIWTLYDRWFDEHVYTIIVHKDIVPPEVLAIYDQEPEELPTWYPGASGAL